MNQARLIEKFTYEPDTGLFRFRKSQRGINAGAIAGHVAKSGYVYLRVDNVPLLAHRAAWIYVYGVIPKGFIDHINHIPSDNRICNLRDCTFAQSAQNMRKSQKSVSGIKGVYWAERINKTAPWLVQIRANGKLHYIGYFKTKEEAEQARREAADRLHGEFACHY